MTPLSPDIERKDELTAINRIRVETTLSRFPIHRLSKSGTAVIDLFPDVQWRVSHNTQYGQPGPLGVQNRHPDHQSTT